ARDDAAPGLVARQQVHGELAVEEAAQGDAVGLALHVEVDVHAAHLARDAVAARGEVERFAGDARHRRAAAAAGGRASAQRYEREDDVVDAHATIINRALRSNAPKDRRRCRADAAR